VIAVFLRKINEHLRTQNWLAIGIDLVVVIIGVVIAFQVTEWNDARKARIRERAAIERLHEEAGEALVYIRHVVAEFDDRNRALESAIRALAEGSWAEVEGAAIADGLQSLGIYPALSPPRSAYDDLVSSGQFGAISSVRVREVLSDYYADLDFLGDQLDYFRQTAVSARTLARSGLAMRYAAERGLKVRLEVDAERLAADQLAMSLLADGLRNQLVFQSYRRVVLERAEAVCASLAELLGKPCPDDSAPGAARSE